MVFLSAEANTLEYETTFLNCKARTYTGAPAQCKSCLKTRIPLAVAYENVVEILILMNVLMAKHCDVHY